MTQFLVMVGLVGGLLVLSRRVRPIAEREARDGRNVVVSDELRATPLPHPTRVATGLRAWLSRHGLSRHDNTPCDCDTQSPDTSDPEPVECAPGVHVSRQPLDEWLRAQLDGGTDRATLARAAVQQYGISLRTAQRRITAIDGTPQ